MATLDVQNLVKTYGKVKALDGVTFHVGAGETFGFVGSNGAGKTTTMRIIMGVLSPDSGAVLWDGKPITFADRRRIGYMPEERGLYPKMPVGAQLTYLAQLQGLTPAAAKKAAHEWADRLGIGTRMKDDVQNLSLGNQQRVQLAAALVAGPQMLILDEPFSGLDPVAVEVMAGVLQQQAAAGVPVIFSSHQLELVERLSDRVGIISAGRMVADGTIDQLRRTDRPQFVVNGAPHQQWLGRVPGAQVVAAEPIPAGVRTTIQTNGGDGQELLAAALTAGPVHEFSRSKPHLTDLYRHVVETNA